MASSVVVLSDHGSESLPYLEATCNLVVLASDLQQPRGAPSASLEGTSVIMNLVRPIDLADPKGV